MAWGDKFITKNKDVRPVVWFSFKADQLAGSVGNSADKKYLYVIANECIKTFSIHIEVGNPGDPDHRKFALSRKAQSGKRYFSDHYNTYVLPYHHAKDLNDIFHAKDANRLKMKITMEVKYGLLSEYILRYVARTANDSNKFYNLANPDPADEIKTLNNRLTKVWHSKGMGKKHKFKTKYKTAKGSERLVTVNCQLSDRDVDNSGTRSKVKLYIYLRIKEDLSSPVREQAVRRLLAADHYKLILMGKWKRFKDFPYDIQFFPTAAPSRYDISGELYLPPTSIGGGWTHLGTNAVHIKEGNTLTAIQKTMRTWYKNVFTYFVNYVDVNRGKLIRTKLVQQAKTLAMDPSIDRKKLVMKIRDSVDKYLITANHWHGSRELFKKETHQHIFSDIFGEIHGKTYHGGSPVFFVRSVPEEPVWWKQDTTTGTNYWAGSHLYWLSVCKKNWNEKEKVGYCLQIGAGHCGEHAHICFSILKEAIATDANVKAKLKNIIYTGNANIDHAFCIVGMIAKTVYVDKRTKKWKKRKKGEILQLWDLRAEINGGQTDGVVLDAYLGDLQKKTPDKLLQKIKRKEKTHYLNYINQSPETYTSRVVPTLATPDTLPDI